MTSKAKHVDAENGKREASEARRESYHPLESVGYLINLAARLAQLNLGRHLDRFAVSPAQVPLVFWLLEEEGLTQVELCERTHIEQPSIAVSLANMERKGLIVRKQDRKDRRKYRIYLSGTMKRTAKNIHLEAMASNREILSVISPRTSAQFMKVLKKVIKNLSRIT